MNKNKPSLAKTTLALIFMFTFGTVLGITAYLISLKNSPLVTVEPTLISEEPVTSPIPETDNIDASSWKKFESGDFGFEIAYPADVSLDGPDLIDLSNTRQLSSIDFYGPTEAEPVFITVEVYERPEDITRESIYSLDYHKDLLDLQKKDGLQEAFSAANSKKEGVVYDASNPEKNISQKGEVNGPRLSYLTNVLTKDSRYEYMIGISLPLNGKGMNEEILKNISETLQHYIDVYNKMIESFKITSEMPPYISWETWKWDKECGNFEVKYPSEWALSTIYSDKLGCTGEVYFKSQNTPNKTESKASLSFDYSATSVTTEMSCGKAEQIFENFPEKSYSAGLFRCSRSEGVSSESYISLECCARTNRQDKGYLFAGVNLVGDERYKNETQINQILSTLRFIEQ